MNCIVCKKKSWNNKYENLSECKNCGFIRARDKYFKINSKKVYSKKYFEGEDYFDYGAEKLALQTNFARRVNDIRKFKKGGKLLEIGAAYGFFLDLAKKKFKSYGIDVNPEITSMAKKNSGVKVFTGDFLKANVGSSYDVVCMYDVIEHLKVPEKFLKKIYKILKPNGIVQIETGDIEGYLPKLQKNKWRLIKPPLHLQYFSKKTLTTLLENNGFKILDFKYVSFSRTVGQIAYRSGVGKYLPFLENILNKIVLTTNTYDIMLVTAQKSIRN